MPSARSCSARRRAASRDASAADIRSKNSKIIYCNIGAFGDAGPYKERRGYDPLMQASAGLMSVTGEGGDRPPVRVGTSIIDMGTGMCAGQTDSDCEAACRGNADCELFVYYMTTRLAWRAKSLAARPPQLQMSY